MDQYTVMAMHDLHVPYHDKRAFEVALDFAVKIKPNELVCHEWFDWYQISKFSRDPARLNKLQRDLDECKEYIGETKRRLKNTKLVFLKSNHDARLQKYLWTHAKELSSLRELRVEHLLGLEDMGIPYKDNHTCRGVLWKHGDIVRKHSSYTSKGEFEREGMNGASGHTHRLGMYFVTLRGGKYVWIEGGCLCNLNPEWMEGIANWQHGVSVFTFKGNTRHFHPAVHPIIDYEVIYGGKAVGS